ncbi:carbohydrate binding domain-containing protein [Streptomyces sp. NPDC018031]|uniref:carbohydrate binding domain-containing protein n=1 Tax=Streptomyces sp. NPDC018031 TaxID=3365033 RepID=UPI003790734D
MRVVRTSVLSIAAMALAFPVVTSGAAAAEEPTGTEMLGNTTFDNGLTDPWSGNDLDPRVENGELVTRVPTGRADGNPGGAPSWDRSVNHSGLAFTAGQQYKLSFDARTSRDVAIVASVYTFNGRYIPEWDSPVALSPETRHVELTVTLHQSVSDVSFGFQLAHSGAAYDIALDNVSLTPVTEG